MKTPTIRFKGYTNEWKLVSFKTLFSEVNQRTGDVENYPLYSLTVQDGVTRKTDRYNRGFLVKKENNFKIVKPEYFVSNPMNMTIGAVAQYKGTKDITVSGYYNVFKNISNYKNPFLEDYLKSSKMIWLYKSIATGSLIEKQRVHFSQFIELSMPLPSVDEANRISDFMEKLTKKIQLQQQKIDLLKEQKKAYMHKIFNQELRFKDTNRESFPNWEEKFVSDILKLNLREVEKPTNAYMRLGLRSHAKGTFHELVTNVESINMDKLYEVHQGDFIINITFAWEQALAVADKNDHGKLVSHRFPTYLFKENHHKDFYKYFFTTKYFKYCLGNASPGGAGRNRVLNKTDFMNIQVNVPTYDEQIKISRFLNILENKSHFEEQKLKLLQQQKQAFMQQMFI